MKTEVIWDVTRTFDAIDAYETEHSGEYVVATEPVGVGPRRGLRLTISEAKTPRELALDELHALSETAERSTPGPGLRRLHFLAGRASQDQRGSAVAELLVLLALVALVVAVGVAYAAFLGWRA